MEMIMEAGFLQGKIVRGGKAKNNKSLFLKQKVFVLLFSLLLFRKV